MNLILKNDIILALPQKHSLERRMFLSLIEFMLDSKPLKHSFKKYIKKAKKGLTVESTGDILI